MFSDSQYLLLFSINLTYVVVCIYGWLLKTFHVPAAYKDIFGELYPARYTLANLFMMQVFELPFLFFIWRPEVLFMVNGSAMMFLISYMVILVKGYFFLDFYKPSKLLFFMHPAIACWVVLLLPVFGIIEFTPLFKTVMTCVVMAITLWYVFRLDQCRIRLMNEIRSIDEDEFSNETDFPVKFAKSVKWLPFFACAILIATFLANDYYIKMVRDIIFIVINVWFAIYTLNPHRKTKKLPKELKKKVEEEVVEVQGNKHRLSEKYCKETETRLINIIMEKKLYLEEHFTMNDLIDIMHINRNYLSEVIARSKYQSFYRLVNTLRIEHACEVLRNDPTAKLEQVALLSGFTSGSSFSQIFRRVMDVSPKEYISQIHAE